MDRIELKREHWDMMLNEVKKCYPEEACGILGGIDHMVEDVIPVTNILHSPTRYRMDPQEQLNAMQQIEDKGHSILGIYHSHVNGLSGLSATDLNEAYYPEAAYLVLSKLLGDWECKAFLIEDRRARELAIVIQE
jgi:proteasome lid subunit RPN8/RPN11